MYFNIHRLQHKIGTKQEFMLIINAPLRGGYYETPEEAEFECLIRLIEIVKQKYKSTSDHIYHTILNYDTIVENNKLVAIPNEKHNNQIIVLIPNRYPYYFEQNITQYVLWSNEEIN